jgi:hypothetical protein
MLEKNTVIQAPVAHAWNPSYSGGRDQQNHCSKPAQANSSQDPISKEPIVRKGWWSSSRCRPWVQTLVPQKKKKYNEMKSVQLSHAGSWSLNSGLGLGFSSVINPTGCGLLGSMSYWLDWIRVEKWIEAGRLLNLGEVLLKITRCFFLDVDEIGWKEVRGEEFCCLESASLSVNLR